MLQNCITLTGAALHHGARLMQQQVKPCSVGQYSQDNRHAPAARSSAANTNIQCTVPIACQLRKVESTSSEQGVGEPTTIAASTAEAAFAALDARKADRKQLKEQ